jgi:hypothetical protein
MSSIRWSEYEIETNPWARKEHVEAAMLFRGVAIAAWAAIETTLSELAFRASHHTAYLGIRDSFPYPLRKRLEFFKEVLDRDGPLSPFRALAGQVIARWESGATMRHILAHGRMRVMSGPGKLCMVRMVDLRPGSDRNGVLRSTQWTLDEFGQGARRAARKSRLLQRLTGRIDALGVLSPLATN